MGSLHPPPQRDPVTEKIRPGLLVVRSGEKSDSWQPTLSFLDSFDWRRAIRSCEEQFPERGKIDYRLDVPDPAGEGSSPNRIALHVGGALGGTRLAGCISGAFEAASARFTVEASEGSVLYGTFVFPFDPAELEKKLQRLRDRMKAEQARSSL